jgi:hypothetical protein
MGTLQSILEDGLAELPRTIATEIVRDKLITRDEMAIRRAAVARRVRRTPARQANT